MVAVHVSTWNQRQPKVDWDITQDSCWYCEYTSHAEHRRKMAERLMEGGRSGAYLCESCLMKVIW